MIEEENYKDPTAVAASHMAKAAKDASVGLAALRVAQTGGLRSGNREQEAEQPKTNPAYGQSSRQGTDSLEL